MKDFLKKDESIELKPCLENQSQNEFCLHATQVLRGHSGLKHVWFRRCDRLELMGVLIGDKIHRGAALFFPLPKLHKYQQTGRVGWWVYREATLAPRLCG